MIGNRLAELREELNITKTTIASDLKMTPSSYGLYEREQRSPDYKTLKKMADYFNVSMAYLLGETDIRKPLSQWTTTNNETVTNNHYISQLYSELNSEGQERAREYMGFLKTKYKKK